MFITIDGGDGCGKSTQCERLGKRFQSRNREVVLCRDPGSTPLGDAVRDILLHARELHIGNRSEMFLFMAARAQMVDDVIRPALESGKIVVSDRFLLSSLVYQGCAGGVATEAIRTAGRIATDGLMPDLAIVLDIPYEVAVDRVGRRADPDRMERKGEAYHRRVRDGFLALAAADPEHHVVVDAASSPDVVENAVWRAVTSRFPVPDASGSR